MRLIRAIVPFFFALIGAASARANPALVERRIILSPVDARASTFGRIDAQVLVFEDSDWTLEQVKAEFETASAILNQCQLRIGTLSVRVDARPGVISVDGPYGKLTKEIARGLERRNDQLSIIFLYDTGSYRNEVTGRLEQTYAFAHNPYWAKEIRRETEIPEFGNTIFIGAGARARTAYEGLDPSFNTVAHEIGHVLGDMGHVMDSPLPNLMSGRISLRNGTVLPENCEKFRRSKLVQTGS